MHNRQALKHCRRHGDLKLEHREDTDRMEAQVMVIGISKQYGFQSPSYADH
jgi:hypothetical protein